MTIMPTDIPSSERVKPFLSRAIDIRPDRPSSGAPRFLDLWPAHWNAFGLRPGDLVILALPNGIRLLDHFFGVLTAGGVPVLTSPRTPASRLLDIVAEMGARAVVAPHMSHDLHAASARVDAVADDHIAVFAPHRKSPPTTPGEVVLLTSGTSGFSSGCVFGIEALLLNATRHADAIGQRNDDTVLVNLPLHFSFALVAQALATLVRGGRLIIDGPPFHPPSYFRVLEEYQVSISSLTPVLVRSLLKSGLSFPTDKPRVLTVGGDSLPPAETAQLLALRPGRELYLTYGLTEAGPRVATLAAHREPPSRYASIGHALAGTQVSLADAGNGLQQLLVSSDSVMRRRIGRVEGRSCRDVGRDHTVETGDVFEQDTNGYLFHKGRLSDFIVRGDDKICLASVRRIAVQLPHVLMASTKVIRTDEGRTDYILTLAGDGQAMPDHDACRAALSRLLRRGEMPGTLEIVCQSDRHQHK